MTEFALIVAAWILGPFWLITLLGQGFLTLAYFRRGHRRTTAALRDGDCPPVAVVLCIRGADPNLAHCLAALDRLDYPDYEVHIALDAASDPAASLATEFALTAARPFTVHTMPAPVHNGGLKCDRLLQLLAQLPERLQHIAFIDADVRPPKNWLRELLGPLQDMSIGAVSGNRWYLPRGFGLVNSLRVMWNAAAVVQMEYFVIPWGGSLALRRRSIETLDLPQIWARSFCEDTVLAGRFAALGQKIVHCPALVLADSSELTWRQYNNWHRRQLLAVRLHHRAWPLVAAHGINGGLATLLTVVVMGGLAAAGRWVPLVLLAGSYAIYMLASIGLMQLVARRNQGWLADLDERSCREPPAATAGQLGQPSLANRSGFSKRYLLWSLVVLPITQLHHAWGLIQVACLRRIRWSQIEYEIANGNVVRGPYRPYLASRAEVD